MKCIRIKCKSKNMFWSLAVVICCICGTGIVGMCEGKGLYMGPYFPVPQPRNISVHQGTDAYLPCFVKQLGNKSVSWVRHRDADILTVGGYTFVRDERFSVQYSQHSENWTLVIKYVQERDAGTYECQVSTEPKMSLMVHLHVIVPLVEVSGTTDKYIRKGSTARLECTVTSTVQLPDYIFWYHSGERVLEYDHPRVRISISRRGGQGSEMSITSALVITNAMTSDEGNYTCLPSNLHSATAILHVLNDEHPAAMQTGAAAKTGSPSIWMLFMVVLISLLNYLHQESHVISFVDAKQVPRRLYDAEVKGDTQRNTKDLCKRDLNRGTEPKISTEPKTCLFSFPYLYVSKNKSVCSMNFRPREKLSLADTNFTSYSSFSKMKLLAIMTHKSNNDQLSKSTTSISPHPSCIKGYLQRPD